MNKLIGFLFTIALTASAPSYALPGDNCQPEQILFGNWAFNRQFTIADGCLVQVTPIDKNGLTYREYVFDESGRMMVFNSLPGDYETATSQRNYFLLPAIRMPTIEQSADRVAVVMANGSKIFFGPQSMFAMGWSEDLTAAQKELIDLSPGGNFEITAAPGILIDAGWRIGDRAYRDENGSSRVIRANQPECLVSNQSLFVYRDPFTREELYQPVLKYRDEESLAALLALYCPAQPGI